MRTLTPAPLWIGLILAPLWFGCEPETESPSRPTEPPADVTAELPESDLGPLFRTVLFREGSWRCHTRDLPAVVGELVVPAGRTVTLILWSDRDGKVACPEVHLDAKLIADQSAWPSLHCDAVGRFEVDVEGSSGEPSRPLVVRAIDPLAYWETYGASACPTPRDLDRVGHHETDYPEVPLAAFEELLEYRVWVTDGEYDYLNSYAVLEEAEFLAGYSPRQEQPRITQLVRVDPETVVEMPAPSSRGLISADEVTRIANEVALDVANQIDALPEAAHNLLIQTEGESFVSHYGSTLGEPDVLWLPLGRTVNLVVTSTDHGLVKIDALGVETDLGRRGFAVISVTPTDKGEFEITLPGPNSTIAGTVHVVDAQEFDRKFPQ